jgi:hypothetical protein
LFTNARDEAVLLYNKGTKLLEQKKPEKALSYFKKVLKIYKCKEAYTNGGNCLRMLDRDTEMFKWYELALDPKTPFLEPTSQTDLHARNNLGLAYFTYGNDNKAIELYTQCIKEKEDFWEAWWNCSTATLRKASAGEVSLFPKGWEMYEARFLKGESIKLKNRRENLPYWDGTSSGEDIVILVEQGIGDSIMFGRYITKLQEKFSRVFVQCDAQLDNLFKHIGAIPIRDPIEISSDSLVAVPMCSLGKFFDLVEAEWLKSYGTAHEFPKDSYNIGVVWSGSPSHANDRHRSIYHGKLRGLSRFGRLYNLNPSVDTPSWINKLPISTWDDTVRYVRGLDLVISVDTSIVHLCGTLGVECWMMQPYKETDFRWGHGESVWYDSVKIYNNPQSWETVISRVSRDLEARVANNK